MAVLILFNFRGLKTVLFVCLLACLFVCLFVRSFAGSLARLLCVEFELGMVCHVRFEWGLQTMCLSTYKGLESFCFLDRVWQNWFKTPTVAIGFQWAIFREPSVGGHGSWFGRFRQRLADTQQAGTPTGPTIFQPVRFDHNSQTRPGCPGQTPVRAGPRQVNEQRLL